MWNFTICVVSCINIWTHYESTLQIVHLHLVSVKGQGTTSVQDNLPCNTCHRIIVQHTPQDSRRGKPCLCLMAVYLPKIYP